MLKFNDIKNNHILYAINLKTYQIEKYKVCVKYGNLYGIPFSHESENNDTWSWVLSLSKYGEHDVAVIDKEYIISVSQEKLYKYVQTTFDDARNNLRYFKDKVKHYEEQTKMAYSLYSSVQALKLCERIRKMSDEELVDFYNNVCMKRWDKKSYCFIIIPIMSYEDGRIDWFHTYRNIKNVECLTEKNISDINNLVNTIKPDTKYISYELLKGYNNQFKKLDIENMINIIIEKETDITNEELI